MNEELSIIFLNGKYKMLGISKGVFEALATEDYISIWYSRETNVLLITKGGDKHSGFSTKNTKATKDFYWMTSELFVKRMEDELCIYRDCVAICLQGKLEDIEGMGTGIKFDTTGHSYLQLGFDNMPTSLEKHIVPRYMHLYQNTFRI